MTDLEMQIDQAATEQAASQYGPDAQTICLNLEASQLKSVMETIIQAFRAHKKYVEKEITLAVNKLTMMKKQGRKSDEILEGLNAHIEDLTNLREKYNSMLQEEDHFWHNLETRAQHLASVGASQQPHDQPVNEVDFDQFFGMKMDRTILDYMLRQGYFTTAKLFAEAKEISEFSDLPVFEEIRRIKAALTQGECQDALDWCNTNRTKLGKVQSTLEFKLRMQEFVNFLSQKNDSVAAMKYAQKNLVKFVSSAIADETNQTAQLRQTLNMQMGEVIRAMGLIGYPFAQRQQSEFYQELTRSARCEDLANAFEDEAYQLYGLNPNATVTQTLSTGISVLKTSLCEEKAEDELFAITQTQPEDQEVPAVNENGKCPTCDPKMRQLGGELPNSMHTLTQLSCSMTGQTMNDSNPPVYLPTGYLICERAKQQLIAESISAEQKDKTSLKCPFTGKLFAESDTRKVYFS